MTTLTFFLGLTVGLSIYAGQQYRFKQQLKKTLRSYTNVEDGEVSLPLQSLIRRELSDLDRQRQKLEQDTQAWQDLIDMRAENRQALGKAARLRIDKLFSLDSVVSKYEKLYSSLAKI